MRATGWVFWSLLVVLTIGIAGCTTSESPGDDQPQPPQKITVFTKGEAGYHCFRIPALVMTPGGTTLAFAEGRRDSCRDDAGETWSEVAFDPGMPEPSVQGSLVRFTTADKHGRNRVLLAHPSSRTERALLTVRMSYDECRTWPVAKLLHQEYSGYSDMAIAPDMTVLCLYESEWHARMLLARFTLDWLTDGADSV